MKTEALVYGQCGCGYHGVVDNHLCLYFLQIRACLSLGIARCPGTPKSGRARIGKTKSHPRSFEAGEIVFALRSKT